MIAFDINNYGYYDDPSQTTPKFDPDDKAPCLICGEKWTEDTVRTIGVMADDYNERGE